MDFTLQFFLLLIGMLIGGLLTLLFDARYFGRRVDAAMAQAQESRQRLRETEKQIARMAVKREPEASEPPRPVQRPPAGGDQTNALRSQLDNARAEFHIMQGNLARVSNQLDQLRADNQALQIRTASAETRSQVMRENFDKLSDAHSQLQESYRQASEKLAAAEVEMRYQQKIALASAAMPQQALPTRLPPMAVESVPAASPAAAVPHADGAGLAPAEAAGTAADAAAPAEAPPPQKAASSSTAAPAAVPAQPAAVEPSPVKAASRSLLQKINGIGPVFSKRLADAGVETYSDFTQLSTEQIATILGLKAWQVGKIAGWVQQAIELSAESGDD